MKKFINKSLALLLAFCMLFCSLPFADMVFAEEETLEDLTENGYTYIYKDYKAIITSTDSNITGDIVIPESLGGYPVGQIGANAFLGRADITSVTFNESLELIFYNAFTNCTELKTITFAEGSHVDIANEAFFSCTSLSTINNSECMGNVQARAFSGTPWYTSQPDGDVYIGTTYFMYKGEMPENTSITIKEGTTKISAYAFADCDGLVSITLPDSIADIENDAFKNCNKLESIIIPDSVKYINFDTFRGCTSLKSVKLPESLREIEKHAFDSCTSLESIEIPDNCYLIWEYAFNGCSGMKNVKIGKGIRKIEEYAFNNCSSLSSVEFSGDSSGSFVYYAFFNCTQLKSIVLPSAVGDIGGHSLGYYYDKVNSSTEKVTDFTIYGYSCTEAEQYANDNEFKFVSIGVNHKFSTWETTVSATYKSKGQKKSNCSFCGAETTKEINIYELKNTETGISLIYQDGSFLNDTTETLKLNIEEISEGINYSYFEDNIEAEKRIFYKITLKNSSSDKTLRAPGWIKMSIPEGFVPEKTTVYYITGLEKIEKIDSFVEDGYLYFEITDFLWYFGIINEPYIQEQETSETTTQTEPIDIPETTEIQQTTDAPNTEPENITETPEEPEDTTKDCTCNCHKTGIMKFFFKFMNFFQRIFKKNQFCECGVAHY